MGACVAAAALLFAIPAMAADMAVKAPVASKFVYPLTSGWFYGVNTFGVGGTATTTTTGSAATIGGSGGVNIGYTVPVGNTFVFGEAMFDGTASTGGNSLTQPGLNVAATFEQRIALGTSGSVAAQFASLFPGLADIAMPSIPTLPAGLSSGPANPYIFGAIHEEDVSAQLMTQKGRSWLVSAGAGVGALTRISNGWMLDTWVEWKAQSTGMVIGQQGNSLKLGNAFLAGVSLKL